MELFCILRGEDHPWPGHVVEFWEGIETVFYKKSMSGTSLRWIADILGAFGEWGEQGCFANNGSGGPGGALFMPCGFA